MSGEIDIVSGGTDTEKSFTIQGRITVANSDQMRIALAKALRTKPTSVAVNLSGVSYLDSSGVATLIEAARIARSQGTRLVLSGIRDQPRYFFEIAHFDRLFNIAGQEAST
jgi:anti-sigma B factor antagonist